MSLISIKNLTFCYLGGTENVFENVSFNIDSDWKLGLTGRNGKGKTTLLKLLLGQYEYKGEISKSVTCEYFPYAIRDNKLPVKKIISQINPLYEEWQIEKDLNLLDIKAFDWDKPLCLFSNGEQTKILISVLFSKEKAFLLIDEPTNHLDRHGREVLSAYLAKKRSFILVSHDKRFLDNSIDHTLSINKSSISVNSGNYSTFLVNKERQDEYEYKQNEKLKKSIEQLTQASKRTSDWADLTEKTKYCGKDDKSGLRPDRGYIGAKAAKLNKRAKANEKRINKDISQKSQLLKNIDYASQLKIESANTRQRLLAVKDLIIKYGNRQVNRSISFEINRGDRLCLLGKNGSGKTSVLKAILNEVPFIGIVEGAQKLNIAYVPQDTSFLKGNLREFCGTNEIDDALFFALLIKMGFKRCQFDNDINTFSQGQKKKVLLAKSLCIKADLFVWDEPLNYIDIITREQIQEMLTECTASMVFVEHDADFCDKIATKQMEIVKFDLKF